MIVGHDSKEASFARLKLILVVDVHCITPTGHHIKIPRVPDVVMSVLCVQRGTLKKPRAVLGDRRKMR
eukprot:scaffold11756_cov104-Skeletonema_marinoi.AAC.2